MHPDVRPPLPFQQRTHTAHFSVRDTDEAHETLAVSNPDNLLGLPGGSSGAMSLGMFAPALAASLEGML